MKKLNKHAELSLKCLGAAIAMATICLYMIAGAVSSWVGGGDFYFHVPFSFLVHGMLVSMIAASVWVVAFGIVKSWGFFARYALFLIISIALYGASLLIPPINFLWVICGFAVALIFCTASAIISENIFQKTGKRSILVWELTKNEEDSQ